MVPTPCPFTRAVDAHFEAGLPADETHALFAHVPSCARCKERYERRLVLESLDPDAAGPKARLRRGLPIAPSEVRPSRRARAIGAASAAIALAAGIALVVTSLRGEGGFHARGGAEIAPSARVEVYRITPGSAPARVSDSIGHKDELAFAYANPAGKKRLLVFAVDERRRVYWYYPAWTRAEETPEAVPIARTTGLVELKDAVTQDIEGSRATLYAVFTDDPLTVRDVEARVAASPPLAPTLGLAGAIETSLALEVR